MASLVENGANAQRLRYCLIVAALAMLACSCRPVVGQEQLTVESRQQKEAAASENELADTIKYLEKLEKLDKYWSEVARPRFGRSEYKQRRHALLRFSPQQVNSEPPMYQQKQQQQQQQQQQRPLAGARQMGPGGPNFLSLMDYVNARMAQRYNSEAAY